MTIPVWDYRREYEKEEGEVAEAMERCSTPAPYPGKDVRSFEEQFAASAACATESA